MGLGKPGGSATLEGRRMDQTDKSEGRTAASHLGAEDDENLPAGGLGQDLGLHSAEGRQSLVGFHWVGWLDVIWVPVQNTGTGVETTAVIPTPSLSPVTFRPSVLSPRPPPTSVSDSASLSGRTWEALLLHFNPENNFPGQVSNQYTDSQLLQVLCFSLSSRCGSHIYLVLLQLTLTVPGI